MIDKTKLTPVLLVAIVVAITCTHPIYPNEQTLQHIGIVLLLIPLTMDVLRKQLPMSAFIGIVGFTSLHVIGARYIYSYAPYKEWTVPLGSVEKGFFCDPCNHYNRLVHFSFGALLFSYSVYPCRRWVKQQSLVVIVIAWMTIQTGSLIYELLE